MTPPITPSSERGAVLALALVVMFVLVGLMSTAFIVVLGESAIGRGLVQQHQAGATADAGVYSLLSRWNIEVYNVLQVGDSASFAGSAHHGGGRYEGTVLRLGPRLFLVAAEGTLEDGARQRVGVLMRLETPRLSPKAAIEIRGPLQIGTSVRISGIDVSPYGWNCPDSGSAVAALRISSPNSTPPSWSGCPSEQCLTGEPGFELDSMVRAADLLDFEGLTLDDLRAVASHVVDGETVRAGPKSENEMCVTESSDNWGNPYDQTGPCGDYFPVIYSRNDLTIAGGIGQGVLVVDGDLTLVGGFHYRGIIIVLGRFNSIGIGSRVEGAVIVANTNLGDQILEGTTVIQYSSCVVGSALAGSGRGTLLRERSWLDMY